eukprot:519204_1
MTLYHIAIIVHFQLLHSVTIKEFFKFNNGESIVPIDDDNYVEVALKNIIPYYGNKYKTIYVSTNGCLSFNHGVKQFTPDQFPLEDHLFLSAFWADVDTRGTNAGKVYYRESTEAAELSEATKQIVAVFRKLRGNFYATSLFIATWDHVGYYDQKSDKLNTFQTVVVTNGRKSFVIFNYLSDNGIQWTYGDFSVGVHAQCGFNKGDGKTHESLEGSYTADVINLHKKTNIGIPGRFMFGIDAVKIYLPPPKHTEL